MTRRPLAYLPVPTYPEPVPDEAVLAALDFASSLKADVHLTAFAADMPALYTPLMGRLVHVDEMVHAAEETSRRHCERLTQIAKKHTEDRELSVNCFIQKATAGAMDDIAAFRARYFDLSLLAWTKGPASRDLAEAIIFGSGRPSILVPDGKTPPQVAHIAVAWDESRVAARALADALAVFGPDIRITVMTVRDDKPLPNRSLADSLASSLKLRDHEATAETIDLKKRPIALALQEHAIDTGADLLVLGAFGHSRVRDFVLGGATTGVLTDLRMPALLSH